MVADTDNSGQKDDESLPKITGEEPIEEEFFTSEESPLEERPLDPLQDPLQDVEPLGRDIPPQGSSVGRKIMTAVGISIVAVGVSMYLTYKQKVKEAAQMEVTPPSKMASIAPPDEKPTTETPAPASVEPKPLETKPAEVKPAEIKPTVTKPVETKPVDEKAEKAPSVDNASLAAAISQSVSASAPTKTETPLTAEISKSVSATIEETPKAVSTTVETASKTVSAAPTDETPAKISETTTLTATTESPKVIGRIDGLDAKTNDLSTRLDSIDKAIVVLNKTVESMEKKITAPVVVAQATKNSLATAVTPVANNKPAHRQVVNQKRPMKVYHEQVMPVRTGLYVVRAIVPGRAWIEGSMGGGAFTVMEGDRIPGTGFVTKVDAENGEVTMDTGEVIKYGTDDH